MEETLLNDKLMRIIERLKIGSLYEKLGLYETRDILLGRVTMEIIC